MGGQEETSGDITRSELPDDSDAEREAIERDYFLALELFKAQPAHPRIPELARSVLARDPAATGMMIVIAVHLLSVASGSENIEEARRLLKEVMGHGDNQFTNATRPLRDLEIQQQNHGESRRLAEVIVRQSDAYWHDHMVYGRCLVFTGEFERGWELLDTTVKSVGESDPEVYIDALEYRAECLLSSGAPPGRFHAAAAQAVAAKPTNLDLAVALGYSHLYRDEFAEADELFRRVLRENPESKVASSGLSMLHPVFKSLESGESSMDDLRRARIGELLWRTLREVRFGVTGEDALVALDSVMPPALAASLLPGLSEEAAYDSGGLSHILAWRNGQEAGTGALWGSGDSFRLMSAAEIDEMDDAIEGAPEDWPQWQVELGYYTQFLTDDAGAYVILGTGGQLFVRRAQHEDQLLAPSLADWLWDRVVAFGGEDPRPPGWAHAHGRTT